MVMKRRKRKPSSQAAKSAKIPVAAKKAASPSTATREPDHVIDIADEFLTAVEEERPASDAVAIAEAHDNPHSRNQSIATSIATMEEKKSPAPAAAPAPTGADRRTHPRYEVTAAVEVIAPESGARIATRVRDLSQQGCYVDTNNPLPLGTITDVRIKKSAQLFEAPARVVYSRAGS